LYLSGDIRISRKTYRQGKALNDIRGKQTAALIHIHGRIDRTHNSHAGSSGISLRLFPLLGEMLEKKDLFIYNLPHQG
jgi:hypothetical protein